MKKLILLVFVLCIAFLFYNCTEDDFDTRTVPNLQTTDDILRDEEFIAENFGAFTTGNFFGHIEDADGEKLDNVQVTIGNKTTYTDRNGVFLMTDADVYENFAHIKIKKDGYIDGSRVVIPKTTGENRIRIVMFKKDIVASVNSGEPSMVSLPNGTKVNFSGGFVRQDGTTYNGQVDVVLNYVQPNTINTYIQMPGSLFAQTAENDATYLDSFGMMSVNLFSPSGERLNINQFSRATIELPIYNTSDAPDFIPLWYFDEERGYWKEEGQAVRFSNMYVAEVSHFTWWNCDLPLDFVNVCFSMSTTNTNAAIPYQVVIRKTTNYQTLYYGYMTANQSVECGLIPRDEEIRFEVYQSSGICNGAFVHLETFSGFSTDTTVDVSFAVSASDVTQITGMANSCNGDPITNGYIYIDDTNTFSIDNGIIDITVPYCETTSTTIQLFDFDSNLWTIIENVMLNGQPIALGNMSACDDSGGILNGNLVLSTQQEVNDFGAFGITSINGDLIIGNENGFSDIVDLTPIASIAFVANNLKIVGNENLVSLQGLENISDINGNSLFINNNPSLTSLVGFGNLSNISRLVIYNNNNLTSLQGIENFELNSENNLTISGNNALVSLQGVETISELKYLDIRDNDALNTLAAFENLTQAYSIRIDNNNALTTLVGLEQLIQATFVWIVNNNTLLNLNGLDNLVTVPINGFFTSVSIGALPSDTPDSLVEAPNPNLSDFCALENLFLNGNGTGIDVAIQNNAYNPSVQDMLNGNCSQ